MKLTFVLALTLLVCAATAVPHSNTSPILSRRHTSPILPRHPQPISSAGNACDALKDKCIKNGAKFGKGLLKPLSACKAFRSCKRVCRKEKRSSKRYCRRSKRACRRDCRKVRRGRRRRRCRRDCRRTKRRCKRHARRTKRHCKRTCQRTYKTAACKKARRGILSSGLKTVGACAQFLLCSKD